MAPTTWNSAIGRGGRLQQALDLCGGCALAQDRRDVDPAIFTQKVLFALRVNGGQY